MDYAAQFLDMARGQMTVERLCSVAGGLLGCMALAFIGATWRRLSRPKAKAQVKVWLPTPLVADLFEAMERDGVQVIKITTDGRARRHLIGEGFSVLIGGETDCSFETVILNGHPADADLMPDEFSRIHKHARTIAAEIDDQEREDRRLAYRMALRRRSLPNEPAETAAFTWPHADIPPAEPLTDEELEQAMEEVARSQPVTMPSGFTVAAPSRTPPLRGGLNKPVTTGAFDIKRTLRRGAE